MFVKITPSWTFWHEQRFFLARPTVCQLQVWIPMRKSSAEPDVSHSKSRQPLSVRSLAVFLLYRIHKLTAVSLTVLGRCKEYVSKTRHIFSVRTDNIYRIARVNVGCLMWSTSSDLGTVYQKLWEKNLTFCHSLNQWRYWILNMRMARFLFFFFLLFFNVS